MTRHVFASSVDGQRLSQLAEEIAQATNPQCWFDLKDVSKLDAGYWYVLDSLYDEQEALLGKPVAAGQLAELGVG